MYVATVKPIIDVSWYQGEMDWEKAAPLILAAGIKASQYMEDGQFRRNWEETERLGIPRFGYHYLVPGPTWREQARLFASLAVGGELPPMLDVEEAGDCNQAEMAACIVRFCEEVDQLLGQEVGIYTSWGFWNGAVGDTGKCWKRRLWVANYTGTDEPLIPDEWGKRDQSWLYWQWSSKRNKRGKEFGARGSVDIDINRFNGTEAEFAALLGGQPGPQPSPPAPLPERERGETGGEVRMAMVDVDGLNVRLRPWGHVVSGSRRGEEWEVMGQEVDGEGRVWYRSSMPVYLASWLMRKVK